eukprot:439354-Rhodomonas_salina.1
MNVLRWPGQKRECCKISTLTRTSLHTRQTLPHISSHARTKREPALNAHSQVALLSCAGATCGKAARTVTVRVTSRGTDADRQSYLGWDVR